MPWRAAFMAYVRQNVSKGGRPLLCSTLLCHVYLVFILIFAKRTVLAVRSVRNQFRVGCKVRDAQHSGTTTTYLYYQLVISCYDSSTASTLTDTANQV